MPAEPEEWNANDPETFIGTCERCNKVRPVQMTIDPFAVEGITDDDPNEKHAWCYPCLQLRCDDV